MSIGLVSIITVVKENPQGLVATINSILQQDYADWECLIVCSNLFDETARVAMDYKNLHERIKVFVENESGIYGAMNTGLDNANGEYVWFMNAGDKFSSEKVVNQCVNYFKKLPDNYSIVMGNHLVENMNKNNRRKNKRISRLRFAFSRRMSHQAMCFKSNFFKDGLRYNLNYKYAADAELIINLLERSELFMVRDFFAIVEPGGLADKNLIDVYKEKHMIRKENLTFPGAVILSLLWNSLLKINLLFRRLI